MKMQTFYKKLPLFIKKTFSLIYKKLQPAHISYYKKTQFLWRIYRYTPVEMSSGKSYLVCDQIYLVTEVI